jgi:hypothetical protein
LKHFKTGKYRKAVKTELIGTKLTAVTTAAAAFARHKSLPRRLLWRYDKTTHRGAAVVRGFNIRDREGFKGRGRAIGLSSPLAQFISK